ncbi:MAG TPA: hypothetical protein VGD55_01610 [Acidothermaceae bacterium]
MGRSKLSGLAFVGAALIAAISLGCSGPKAAPGTAGNARQMCVPDQLTAEVSGPDGTGGAAEYRVTIRDDGVPCSLPSAPKSLTGVDASGRQIRLTSTPLPVDDIAAMTTGRPADLTNKVRADVVLLTGIACPAAQPQAISTTPQFVSLRLGIGTGTLVVPFGHGPNPANTTMSLPCGVEMSDFYASFLTG